MGAKNHVMKKDWRKRLRAFKRKRLNPFWLSVRWPLIGGTWAFALILGYIGFYRYSLVTGQESTILDIFYRAMQLIVMQSGDVEGFVPWQLNMARYLLPILAAYAAIQALLAVFREQWQQLMIRFARNHAVICGLGERGMQIAKEFLDNGYRVVAIEGAEDNSNISQICDQGAVVLTGDATDASLLRKTRLHRARYLFAVCADDGTNAEIALHARDLALLRRGGPLTAYVHVVDLELCNLLSGWCFAATETDLYRLEFFNVLERGARLILKAYPPFTEPAGREDSSPRFLIVGLGRLGKSLLVQAARNWWLKNGSSSRRLRIAVIDSEAESKLELLRLQYPRLDKACRIESWQMSDDSPWFEKGNFLYDAGGNCDLSAVYICFADDSSALVKALTLHHKIKEYKVPLVVRMSRDAGLASVLKEDHETLDFGQIHVFSLLNKTCSLDALLGGSQEILARAIHEDYVWQQREQGVAVEENPSVVGWEDLPESLKESNRSQAASIEDKLKAVGCGLQPLTDWELAHFEFSPEELEQLAKMEHERWINERKRQGWRYHPDPKNLKKKTSPYLLPWDKLPEEARVYNINTARNLPLYLARVGYQIYRRT